MRGFLNSKANIKGNPNEPGAVCILDMKQDIAGKIFDKSGNGNDGTLEGNPRQGSCALGDSLTFDGTNDYINLGNNASLNLASELTFACWVRFNSITGEHWLFAKDEASGRSYCFGIEATGKMRYQLSGSAGTNSVNSLLTDQWYHLGYTYSAATGKVRYYINGERDSETTAPNTIAITTTPVEIARRGYTGSFHGYLDGTIVLTCITNIAQDDNWFANQYTLGRRALWMTQPVNNTGTVTSGQIGDSPFRVESGGFAVVDEPDPDTLKPNTVLNSDFANWADPTVPDDWSKVGTHDASNYFEENAGGCRFVSTGSVSILIVQTMMTLGKTYVVTLVTSSLTGRYRTANGSGGDAHTITSAGSISYVVQFTSSASLIIAREPGFACDAVISSITVQEVTSYMKAIECITAGVYRVPTSLFQQTPTEAMGGRLQWWQYKTDAGSIKIGLGSEKDPSATGNYRVDSSSSESLDLVNSGVATLFTAFSAITPNVWQEIWWDVYPDGYHEIFVDGVSVGSITNTAITEATFLSLGFGAGDKISLEPFIKRLLP